VNKPKLLITNAGRKVQVAELFRSAFEVFVTETGAPHNHAIWHAGFSGVVTPRVDDGKAYYDTVLEYCTTMGIKYILPTTDMELTGWALRAEDGVMRGVQAPTMTSRSIAACLDKLETRMWFERAGCVMPDRQWQWPMMLKQRRGAGGRGAIICNSADDYAVLSRGCHADKWIMEQYIVGGKEHTVDVFYGPHGAVWGVAVRRRDEVRGGVISRGQTVPVPDDVTITVDQLGTMLGLAGPVNMQYIVKDGCKYWLEINPRTSGGLPLSVAAGLDVPGMLLEYFTCDHDKAHYRKPIHARAGVRMCSYRRMAFSTPPDDKEDYMEDDDE